MKRHLAMACGAALSLALAGTTYAQNTPPGTDRPGGESSGQSANPNPDMGKAKTNSNMTDPNLGGTIGGPAATNPPPPSTDRPGGESSGQSSHPNPDKPQQ